MVLTKEEEDYLKLMIEEQKKKMQLIIAREAEFTTIQPKQAEYNAAITALKNNSA